MSISFQSSLRAQARAEPEAAVAHLRAYTERWMMLGAQRLLLFAAGLVLQAFYVGAEYVAVSTILIIISEVFDGRTVQQVRSVRSDDPTALRAVLRRVHTGALYNSLMVSFFALSVTFEASGGNRFAAMLYLVAAAIFGAVNAHHLLSALAIRLLVYGAAALAIPLVQVLSNERLFDQNAWLNLLMGLFVFYFIADASLLAVRRYRSNIRQLAQLRAETARTVRARDENARILSLLRDELRAPLASIGTALDLAGTLGPMPEGVSQALDSAGCNAARLTARVDAVLAVQQIETDDMTFDFCDVQLARLIADTVTDAQACAQPHGVTLKMMPIDTDIRVRADPMRLEQVITSLLSSLVKFSDQGGEIILRVTATPRQVRISVTDHGMEDDPVNRTAKFNTSRQLGAADHRQTHDKTVDLNISKQIIAAHGGRLGFESGDTGGAGYYVLLNRIASPRSHPVDHPSPLRGR